MTHSTPNHCSLHGCDSSNATQCMPNTGMHVGQFPCPQPASIPHPCHVPTYPYYPYGVPLPYVLVAPSPCVGAGAAHHACQAGQNGCHPPAVANVSCATCSGPHPPPNASAAPPQNPSAPLMRHQPFPSISFPAVANPCILPILHQGCPNQHQEPELATGSASSSLPQVPKRTAKDIERDIKRSKVVPGGMKNDPLFTPVLDQSGQPNGTFTCSRDGMIIHPESYSRHLRTRKHLGFKLEKFKCSDCSKTYTRADAYKRHFVNGKCDQSKDVGALPAAEDGDDNDPDSES
ncbi:uncharacterized protein EDB93DRAFT_782049 [Suillus bovinus]|uniref:uncharacterized protein n=1 Tax=Suillus bovinus TaxID=48563 RepID=UPI001B8763D3|nr:uncharacterized protein EDB93DRAFT_782049 [Suillus bovinus]KAG2136516.1 hypothetical protein EDB93DRAFT_782049 [Suillus bovinus]